MTGATHGVCVGRDEKAVDGGVVGWPERLAVGETVIPLHPLPLL